MNDSHRFAQSYLEDKGYKLLKGVEKKGLSLYSVMNYVLQLKWTSLE
jgi:hypothetical protein